MTALRDVGGANALVRAQNIIDDPAGMAALQQLKEKIRKHPFFGTLLASTLSLGGLHRGQMQANGVGHSMRRVRLSVHCYQRGQSGHLPAPER